MKTYTHLKATNWILGVQNSRQARGAPEEPLRQTPAVQNRQPAHSRPLEEPQAPHVSEEEVDRLRRDAENWQRRYREARSVVGTYARKDRSRSRGSNPSPIRSDIPTNSSVELEGDKYKLTNSATYHIHQMTKYFRGADD